jgi:simple sugar transport system ATP-binding protein
VKIVYGVVRPDEGTIFWEGAPVEIESPNAARRLGIGMVFQHFSLFESLTVAENIALGLGERHAPAALAPRIRAIGARYGLAVDPDRHVHHLSVGERQRVEIVRCLLQEPRLLILDEPTSVLTPQEADGLFVMLRRLAAEGCSILYISHKLEEIAALCHHATVLRAGRVIGECDPTVTAPEAMAVMMVGANVAEPRRAHPAWRGAVRLSVNGLSLPADTPFGTALADVRLELAGGEILGIAGVAGNGQKELLAALAGERLGASSDAIRLDNRPIGLIDAAGRRQLGLAFIPEERLGRGAVAEMSLAENALLTGHAVGLAPRGWIAWRKLDQFASNVITRFRVVAAGIEAEGRSLSGGNMQKFIVGREIALRPTVLLAAHPTWGVDVGAAVAIRRALLDLADSGVAVLVVSEDLAELFEIADRIAVLYLGRLSTAVPTAETSTEAVGRLMGGLATSSATRGGREAARVA